MTTINISSPTYNAANGMASIGLTSGITAKSDVVIDFETLLPFATSASKEVLDFFFLSAAAYGIDRFILRRPNSVDGWSRELKIKMPVYELKKWKAAKPEVEKLLSFLTGDYWEIDFYKSDFKLPVYPLDTQQKKEYAQVNLFSGGLDSLIGSIDFLESNPKKPVLFVSHYDSQMHGPRSDQQGLIEVLRKKYSGRFEYIPSVRVSLENSTVLKETTFRSRSLLFIGIALMAASSGDNSIVVPENGTVSLNFPLTPSRRSACSTRTTHPTLMNFTKSLFNTLGIGNKITNPYEFYTKGEMVAKCKNPSLLREVIKISNSCGKRGHRSHWTDNREATHCGVCMPCVYRRASLQSLKDYTTYGTNLNSVFPFTTKKGQDIGACLQYLSNPMTKKEIRDNLIINGLRDLSQIDKYADVVLRTRGELKSWLKGFGNADVKRIAGIE